MIVKVLLLSSGLTRQTRAMTSSIQEDKGVPIPRELSWSAMVNLGGKIKTNPFKDILQVEGLDDEGNKGKEEGKAERKKQDPPLITQML